MSEKDTIAVSAVFSLVADLAIAVGAAPINRLPGCWVHNLGEGWIVAVNGHPTTQEWGDTPIAPYHVVAQCRGWPVGLFGPYSGTLIGGVSAEDELIALLRRRVLEAGGKVSV